MGAMPRLVTEQSAASLRLDSSSIPAAAQEQTDELIINIIPDAGLPIRVSLKPRQTGLIPALKGVIASNP